MSIPRIILVSLIICTAGILHAQVAADPLDFFYDDLVVWETMGLVNNLPAARPYPLPLVRSVLQQVIKRGDAVQRDIAESHYKRFFGRILTLGGKSEAAIDNRGRRELSGALALDLNYAILEQLTMSVSADVWATNKLFSEELRPEWEHSDKDIVKDNAKIGPFWILPSINSSIAIGSSTIYLNAGLMRGSWGPFHTDGVIVGSHAIHSGQLNFVIQRPNWTLNVSQYSLAATDALRSGWRPEKFFSVHSIDVHPFDWFSISLVEGVVYGGRFETMYLLPLSPYMISQAMTGFVDNIWLGGMFSLKPLAGMRVDGVLWADDLGFNDIVRFNFDTKWRLAGQTGISYAPRKSGIFTRAAIDYTMVTPYTYSHRTGTTNSFDTVNFQNYTHGDYSFGASLDPNSDRLQLKMKLRPLEKVDVDLIGRLIRHGNINESLDWRGKDFFRVLDYLLHEDGFKTDGTVKNHSFTNRGHAFNSSTPFLSQKHIQHIWQAGIDVRSRLPILKTGGYMVFRLAYTFEANFNRGINNSIWYHTNQIYTDPNNPNSPLVSDPELLNIMQSQYDQWKANIGGHQFNHFIRLAFEYYF